MHNAIQCQWGVCYHLASCAPTLTLNILFSSVGPAATPASTKKAIFITVGSKLANNLCGNRGPVISFSPWLRATTYHTQTFWSVQAGSRAHTHTHTFLYWGLTQCQTELSNNNRNNPRQFPDREQWAPGPSWALLPRCLNTKPGHPVHPTSCSINTRQTAGWLSWGHRGKGREPHWRTWRWRRGISIDRHYTSRLLRWPRHEASADSGQSTRFAPVYDASDTVLSIFTVNC